MTVPVITPLPTPPSRADTVNFASRADSFLLALPTFAEESNEVASYLNNMSDSVAAYDALASYRGAWSALFGAVSMPATVSHSGNIYALTENISSASAHEPGVSTAWQLVRARSTDISHGTGTVSSAISTLQSEIDTNSTNITTINTTISNTLMPKSGGTFTGNISVPSINGGQLAGFRNKIINGVMNISQRGTSFAITSNLYTLDRWLSGWASSAVATVSQQADTPTGGEFQNSYRLTATTADTSIAASDQAVVIQCIEGFNVRDLIGKTFTLSFWIRSSKTGKHCVAFRNSGLDRSYVAEYTVSVANTWEYKTVTVTGGLPTSGTWNLTNGVGMSVTWTLMSGTTYQASSANTWQTGNYVATSGIVNCLDTVGNIFAITGVQLEVGPNATPYEHRHYGTELALCQRYYIRSPNYGASTGGNAHHGINVFGPLVSSGALIWASAYFPVTMRAAPTVTTSDFSGSTGRIGIWTSVAGAGSSGIVPYNIFTNKDGFTVTDYNNSKYGIAANYQADAELY